MNLVKYDLIQQLALAPTLRGPALRLEIKSRMFKEFSNGVSRLQSAGERFATFLAEIPMANMEVLDIHELPRFSLPETPRLAYPLARIAAMDEASSHRELSSLLTTGTQQVASVLTGGLQHLYEKHMVGGVRYPADGVVVYDSYFWTAKEDVVSVRDTGRRIETDYRRSLRQTKSYHELMDCCWHHVDDSSVPRPERVQSLIKSMPPELVETAKIITGTEIYKEVSETLHSQTRTETIVKPPLNTYHCDPALVLGPYVLCSW